MVRVTGWAKRVAIVGSVSTLLLSAWAAEAAPLDAAQADRVRIQHHLSRVEAQLREVPVVAFTPEAQVRRARLLDELHGYWRAGVFPRNSGHPFEQHPYFIDHEGRACAVGALVQRSGHEALAQRIDQQFHTEYVLNMADAELLAWAEAHGFTAQELASIQPGYCNCDGYDGGFGPEPGQTPVDGAELYQPVCGSNGLTYWNECIAEICGGVTVVATGTCESEAPCELCGTGSRQAVVAECGLQGICNGIDSQPQVAPVNPLVAERWVELQDASCEAPNYDLEEWGPDEFWRPSGSFSEQWHCSAESVPRAGAPSTGGTSTGGGTSNGGAPGSGAPGTNEPPESPQTSSGCSSVGPAPNGNWISVGMTGGLLAWLRRRRRAPAIS
jgi:hypothetical protein